MEGASSTSAAEKDSKFCGYASIVDNMVNFSGYMALKCAMELRVADIIHSQGGGHPIPLSQIASAINSPSLNLDYLHRIMRMLVRMNIFTSTQSDQNGEDNDDDVVYGLTPSSKLILREADDHQLSLAPILRLRIHPLVLASWQQLSRCVKEGGSGFKKAHGVEFFEMASVDPELNKIYNDGMRCLTKASMAAIVSAYKDGFDGVNGCLVDVGGGIGEAVAEIVKAFPHITGINFDLPHVVAMAPEFSGVSHVAGDMFEAIPTADVVLIKHVLHNWGDEDCVKILKNCRKSIRGKTGKVIIVDAILEEEEGGGRFGKLILDLDLLMIALLSGGKERTELQWKKLLKEGGFSSYNIIGLSPYASLIEAFPE